MKNLLDRISEALDFGKNNPLLYLVHYGATKFESDIDLLAIYKYQPQQNNIILGRLDITPLGEIEMHELLKKHDIIVTEPILLGELIKGNSKSWNTLKRKYKANPPENETIFYLVNRSFIVYSYAEYFLNRFHQDENPNDYVAFWSNMAFAVGYMEFARYYIKGVFPLTSKEILNKSSYFLRITQCSRKAKREKPEENSIKEMRKTMTEFKQNTINKMLVGD